MAERAAHGRRQYGDSKKCQTIIYIGTLRPLKRRPKPYGAQNLADGAIAAPSARTRQAYQYKNVLEFFTAYITDGQVEPILTGTSKTADFGRYGAPLRSAVGLPLPLYQSYESI